MTIILAGLSSVENYLVDIFIYGHNMSMHDKALTAVLQRLQARLFLGYIISSEVLLSEESHVKAIHNVPADYQSHLPLPVDDVDEEFVAFLSADVDAACASCPALTKLHTQISNGVMEVREPDSRCGEIV